ncbi:MAG TPA: zinc-dependent alcohol dehydrogenase family protein [Chroococcales cyanobacterium]
MMKAMIFAGAGADLHMEERPLAEPGNDEILARVHVCGVCRTDLHVLDNELTNPKLPLVLGHEIVAEVLECGSDVEGFKAGQRIGIPWLGGTCGRCRFCLCGRENLCDYPQFTGYTIDGGYATHVIAKAKFSFHLPANLTDEALAPLLCAGLIGWRTLKLAGDGKRLGIYGFGAAAHIIIQVALHQGREVYAFTKPGDRAGQEFARKLGAVWAGASEEMPPELLDSALIFAPVGNLIPTALKASDKGATIVSGGIHMSDIPSFPYQLLWEERSIKSVANLTRQDALEFFQLLNKIPIKAEVHKYQLADANLALADLRNGKFNGAAVLDCSS